MNAELLETDIRNAAKSAVKVYVLAFAALSASLLAPYWLGPPLLLAKTLIDHLTVTTPVVLWLAVFCSALMLGFWTYQAIVFKDLPKSKAFKWRLSLAVSSGAVYLALFGVMPSLLNANVKILISVLFSGASSPDWLTHLAAALVCAVLYVPFILLCVLAVAYVGSKSFSDA